MLLITMLWVLSNSIGKISNGWIRDLGFNADDKELSSGLDVINWNFLKKKKKTMLAWYDHSISLTKFSSFCQLLCSPTN